MLDNELLKIQLETVNQLTGLGRFVIEKDLYVTKALSVIGDLSNELFELIF